MAYIAKKITLIVIALASLLSLADETHATTSYCVASPVECTSYVHPLGFTGYTRPTLGEMYGLTNQNVVDMMGVFTGVLLVQTGAASLTTVYNGYSTGPGASRATKDQVLLSEFQTLTEDDILFPSANYDMNHLAIFYDSGAYYVYALDNTIATGSTLYTSYSSSTYNEFFSTGACGSYTAGKVSYRQGPYQSDIVGAGVGTYYGIVAANTTQSIDRAVSVDCKDGNTGPTFTSTQYVDSSRYMNMGGGPWFFLSNNPSGTTISSVLSWRNGSRALCCRRI